VKVRKRVIGRVPSNAYVRIPAPASCSTWLTLAADVLGQALDQERDVEAGSRDGFGYDVDTVLHLVDQNELVVLPPLGNLWPRQLRMAVDRAEPEALIVELDRDRRLNILVELIGTACLLRPGQAAGRLFYRSRRDVHARGLAEREMRRR
jgi:hypothetical protein